MERPQLTRRSTAPTSLVNVSCRVCGARELVIDRVRGVRLSLCVRAWSERGLWVCVFLRNKFFEK
jgi:hypothetical protein